LIKLTKTSSRRTFLVDKSNIFNYEDGSSYDLVINTTPVSLTNEEINFPTNIFNKISISYDLFYSKNITNFQTWSKNNGATKAYDGLGMLIEQAALSYRIWNSFEPSTKDLKNKLGF